MEMSMPASSTSEELGVRVRVRGRDRGYRVRVRGRDRVNHARLLDLGGVRG